MLLPVGMNIAIQWSMIRWSMSSLFVTISNNLGWYFSQSPLLKLIEVLVVATGWRLKKIALIHPKKIHHCYIPDPHNTKQHHTKSWTTHSQIVLSIMKISALAFLSATCLCSSTVAAFSVLPSAIKPSSSTARRSMFFAEEETGASASAPKQVTIYDRLGFSEDKIAIGIDANEVLQWFGK